MKKFSSILLIVFSLLVWVAPVQAATVPAGFKTWTEQTTTDTRKAWNVKFSAPIDTKTMNSSNIYVKDDKDALVETTLSRSADGVSVQVTPVSPYTVGAKYQLFMTGDIVNSGNKQLSQPLVMPFRVTAPDSKISSVSSTHNSLFTSFTVVASSEVCTVKINLNEMTYQGDNIYSLGLTDLKQGATFKVYAYDSKGKLLQTESHTIK